MNIKHILLTSLISLNLFAENIPAKAKFTPPNTELISKHLGLKFDGGEFEIKLKEKYYLVIKTERKSDDSKDSISGLFYSSDMSNNFKFHMLLSDNKPDQNKRRSYMKTVTIGYQYIDITESNSEIKRHSSMTQGFYMGENFLSNMSKMTSQNDLYIKPEEAKVIFLQKSTTDSRFIKISVLLTKTKS